MMIFRYFTTVKNSKNCACVSCSDGVVYCEGVCVYLPGVCPSAEHWKDALEDLTTALAKQLQESRKDVDQLAEALEQVLKEVDRKPRIVWEQSVENGMLWPTKDGKNLFATKDEK